MNKYDIYGAKKRKVCETLLTTCKTSVEYQKKYETEITKLINKLKI